MTLLAMAAAFVAGLYLADRVEAPVSGLLLLISGALFAGLFLRRMGRTAFPAIVAVAVLLGCLRVAAAGDPSSDLANYHTGEAIQAEGIALEDASRVSGAIRFPVGVERVLAGDEWVEAKGTVLVTARRVGGSLEGRRDGDDVRYGDRVRLEGELTKPPELEEFDYPAYLSRQGIGSVMSFPLVTVVEEGQGGRIRSIQHGVRRRLSESLARSMAEPAASLGQALLLGMREGIPQSTLEDFRATGTSHLLAISGLHVGILLGLAIPLSARVFGRRRGLYLIAPLAVVWSYALLAGMSPSLARASIMGTVYLAALALGRPKSILPALGLAGAVMVAVSPNILWSVSFQLSFAAMAGIATLSEPVSRRVQALFGASETEGGRFGLVIGAFAAAVGTSAAAILATLPLAAFYFREVSLIGLPTTLITLPMLPFALVFHGLAGGLGAVLDPLGWVFGWFAWGATMYIAEAAHVAAKTPGASFETGRIAPLLVVGYYGAWGAWFIAQRWGVFAIVNSRFQGNDGGDRGKDGGGVKNDGGSGKKGDWGPGFGAVKWLAIPSALAAALIWTAALTGQDGRLHVVFADVGNGDSALIVSPSGRHALVDGGGSREDAARLLGSSLPFWDRSVDVVALTHGHADHFAGLLEVLRRYDVEHIVERAAQYTSPGYADWRRAVENEGARVTQATAGQIIDFGDGVTIEVLHPGETLMAGTASDLNNASVVLRVVYGDVSFLLTGDIFVEAEREMVSRGADLSSAVLKVPHHGSRTSSSSEFIEAVGPSAAVISVGADNQFGHPHAEAIDSLRQYAPGARVLMTRDHGTIRFVTDGSTVRVETER